MHPCTHAQATPGAVTQHLDLLRALFCLADRYYVFAREVLIMSPALGQVGCHALYVYICKGSPVRCNPHKGIRVEDRIVNLFKTMRGGLEMVTS